MSEITVKEAYRVLQANCGIEDNDRVRLLRMYEAHEMGCDLCLEDQRNMRIGDIYFANFDHVGGCIRLRDEATPRGTCVGFAPFFCLELVEKAKPEPPPIKVGSHEVEFHGDHITVGCETITGETLRKILGRLEG